MITVFVDGSGSGHSCAYFSENEKYFAYQERATNNEAEYNGVIAALEHLPAGSTAVIKTDSALVHGHLEMNWTINYPHLQEKVNRVRALIDEKDLNVTFKWIPRKENVADLALKQRRKEKHRETPEAGQNDTPRY